MLLERSFEAKLKYYRPLFLLSPSMIYLVPYVDSWQPGRFKSTRTLELIRRFPMFLADPMLILSPPRSKQRRRLVVSRSEVMIYRSSEL